MPYTQTVPKTLLPILDRPLLDLIVSQLERAGIERIGVNAWHCAPRLIEFVRARGCGRPKLDVRIERHPSGPAGALRVFSDLVRSSDVTVVVSGDCLVELDVGALIERHLAADADVSVLTSRTTNAQRYGIVTAGADGTVLAWREKPCVPKWKSLEVSCGVYTIAARALASLQSAAVVDFGRDLIEPLLACGGTVLATPAQGPWRDIGTPQALLDANLEAAAGHYAIKELRHAARRDQSIYLGEGAVVEDDALVLGPAVIGRGARVRAGGQVRRSLLLPGAEVKWGQVVQNEIVTP